jgi:glutamyl-tRNA synthetase
MTERSVRVRIAPSPTGDPHVGTAYVGLFNMVFAKKHGGRFVLRIEDTDQVRSTPESEAAILRSLSWVGLEWDEGPDCGGDFGPYRQSERLHLYQKHVGDLVAAGAAYPCFCDGERLAEVRAEQKANKSPMGYDGRCRRLDAADAAKRVSSGESHVIRLAVPDEGQIQVQDHLRGEITFECAQIDDQVLLKSDGFPTYHLANIVDDHLMEITHVIRAEEWVSSTPKHVLLYDAFGWEPPTFIHLPLLRNLDKSKISKRKNPVSLDYFQAAGFLPETLLNFLGMMGWSMPDDVEHFSVEEMIEAFTWGRMSLSGPVFNLEKLEWLNGVYIRAMEPSELAERVLDAMVPAARLVAIAPLLQERIQRIDQFLPMASYFLTSEVDWELDELIPEGMDRKIAYRGVKQLAGEIDALQPWSRDGIEALLRGFPDANTDWTRKHVFMLTRLIATGRGASPGLFETLEVIGKPLVQDRFRRAMLRLRP